MEELPAGLTWPEEIPERKTCTRCGRSFDLDGFAPRAAAHDGRSSQCRVCDRERVKAWQWAHPGHQTGCTPELYAELMRLQDGKCAICRQENNEDRRLPIDHDHVTDRIRGLLCGACNKGLGIFGESPDRLRAAADYLEVHRGD